MYNIITLKGELMKKLFILTILLSAKLISAATAEEANAILTAAQREHQSHLGKTSESAARLQTLQKAAAQNPTRENVDALNAHITAHNSLVEHCKQCVHGIQAAALQINGENANHTGERHYIDGSVFTGKVRV